MHSKDTHINVTTKLNVARGKMTQRTSRVRHTVIHDGGGDVATRHSLRPGRFYVQVQLGLAPVLTRVLQVPLEREVGVGRIPLGPHVGHKVLHLQGVVSPLNPLETRHLNSRVDLEEKHTGHIQPRLVSKGPNRASS